VIATVMPVGAAIAAVAAPIAIAIMVAVPTAIAVAVAMLRGGRRGEAQRRREYKRSQCCTQAFHNEVSFLLPLNRSVQRKVPQLSLSVSRRD